MKQIFEVPFSLGDTVYCCVGNNVAAGTLHAISVTCDYTSKVVKTLHLQFTHNRSIALPEERVYGSYEEAYRNIYDNPPSQTMQEVMDRIYDELAKGQDVSEAE